MAPGNAPAVAWIDRWPNWPARVLGLHGPAGCGKSHLVQVFAARAAARVIEAAALDVARAGELAKPGAAVAVEEADRGVDERALFHLFNAVNEQQGWLLLTGREAPARWSVALPDLRSRLSAIPTAAIEAPDDAMMQAVLVKLFADRHIAVPPEVVEYLLRHMERSFASARRMADLADRESLAGQRAVTVPLVRALLERAAD
ncbi:MAG: DnaA/Hda family protein [Rhodospirillaceae bacterium]|nr:DnaA/Hda family protein [Rhodospirillaceae bacterium]